MYGQNIRYFELFREHQDLNLESIGLQPIALTIKPCPRKTALGVSQPHDMWEGKMLQTPYGSPNNWGTGTPGIEPGILYRQYNVLPLHYAPPIEILQGENLFLSPPGLEPGTPGFWAIFLPTTIRYVTVTPWRELESEGIEPPLPLCKRGVLPFNTMTPNLVGLT